MKIKNRRVLAAALAMVLMAAGAAMIFSGCGANGGESSAKASMGFTEKTVLAMDAAVNARVWGCSPEKVTEEIVRLDGMLDCHKAESEISQLNSKGSLRLSDETAELISQSLELTGRFGQADISIGAVTALWNVTGESPKVPVDSDIEKAKDTCGYEKIKLSGNECTLEKGAQIDLGCAAKGYALDRARGVLEKEKAECAMVTMGSSTLLYGKKPDGSDFKIAVTDPWEKNRQIMRFTCGEGFVSTSGGYERFFEAQGQRYIHIFDKLTGRPSQSDLVSVTVICKNGLMSDQLSTAIFVAGTKGLGEFLNSGEFAVIAIDSDRNIYASDSIKDKITLENDSCSFKQL